jgi:hypothetical protein
MNKLLEWVFTQKRKDKIYPIGTKTKLGIVQGIHSAHDNPERYYFIVDTQGRMNFHSQVRC